MERMTKAAWDYFSNFNAHVFVSGEYAIIEIGFIDEDDAKSAIKTALRGD